VDQYGRRLAATGCSAGCADAGRCLEEGDEVVLGFDGSHIHNSTALVMEQQPHVELITAWERPETLDAGRD
jgi:hypothetical protein